MKVKKPRKKISKIILSLSWRIDWILANVFMRKRKLSRDLAISLLANDLYSNNKIKNLLNYEFEEIDDSIKKIVKLEKLFKS